jgi:hypothetical protein
LLAETNKTGRARLIRLPNIFRDLNYKPLELYFYTSGAGIQNFPFSKGWPCQNGLEEFSRTGWILDCFIGGVFDLLEKL